MTKRKIFILITIAILLLYSVSIGASYESAEKYTETVYQQQRTAFFNSAREQIKEIIAKIPNRSEKEIFEEFFYTLPRLNLGSGYEYYAVIGRGTVCDAEPSSFIRVKLPYSDYVDPQYIYIDMDDYLTDEVKKEIVEFKKKCTNETFIIEGVDLYQEGDTYIPVKMRLRNGYFKANEATEGYLKTEIVLSDKIANLFCNRQDKEENYHYFHFYDLGESKKHSDFYKILYNMLDSDKAEAQGPVTQEEIANTLSKQYKGIRTSSNKGTITVNDTTYFLRLGAVFDCRTATLNSDIFVQAMSTLTALYLFIYIGIIIFTMRLHTKNQRINEAKQVFVSAAAHELKTPISVIQNQCECIIENIAPEKNGEYIKSVYDESKRMGDVVSTMLWYNRLSTENKVTKARCSLSDLVRKEVIKYETFAQSKGVTVETDIADEIYKYCDETLITMAVDNYLSNAIKYAKGEKKVRLSLKFDLAESRPTLTVFNTGELIPDEHRSKIWDVFWRADKVRNSSDNSTGMGLAICQQVFRLHKYKYGFINKENGVEFYFVTK